MANEVGLKATIQLVDRFTRPMSNAIRQTKTFEAISKRVKPIVLKAKDMASKVVSKVKSQVDKFKSLKYVQVALKAIDMATKVVGKVLSGLKRIGSTVVSATVKVADKASSALQNIKGKLMAIAGLAVTATVGVGFKGLASEQSQKITINRVIENAGSSKEDAKKSGEQYYKYLQDYANKTPFETAEVSQMGTKAMMMSKGNIDNAKKYTDAMGNVKAFVGDLRTTTEVAEGFFSASNGNMDMLNNMLGENYNTFDEALKGIQSKQGGLVNEMSTTVGGLWSTIVGKAKLGATNFVKAFDGPIKAGMNNFIKFVDKASLVMQDVAKWIGKVDFGGLFASFDFSSMTNAIKPVVDLVFGLFKGIEEKSPATMGIIQIFSSAWNTTWQIVGAVIEAVKPTIEMIFQFIASHSEEISNIIKTVGSVWKAVWGTVGPILSVAWKAVEPLLSAFLKGLSGIATMIQKISKFWMNMVNGIKNNPIVANISNAWDKVTGKRSAFGTKRVVGNDQPYKLHDGEMVLTRSEADRYQKGNGANVVVNVNGMTIREEADIDRIASSLVRKINQNRIVLG